MRASGLVEARVQDRFYSLWHRTAKHKNMPWVITVLHAIASVKLKLGLRRFLYPLSELDLDRNGF